MNNSHQTILTAISFFAILFGALSCAEEPVAFDEKSRQIKEIRFDGAISGKQIFVYQNAKLMAVNSFSPSDSIQPATQLIFLYDHNRLIGATFGYGENSVKQRWEFYYLIDKVQGIYRFNDDANWSDQLSGYSFEYGAQGQILKIMHYDGTNTSMLLNTVNGNLSSVMYLPGENAREQFDEFDSQLNPYSLLTGL